MAIEQVLNMKRFTDEDKVTLGERVKEQMPTFKPQMFISKRKMSMAQLQK